MVGMSREEAKQVMQECWEDATDIAGEPTMSFARERAFMALKLFNARTERTGDSGYGKHYYKADKGDSNH